MDDVAVALANRVQLTTDGHKAYLEAVEGAFGADIDYAMLIKIYGSRAEGVKGRYSPAECTGVEKKRIEGKPDPGAHLALTTSSARTSRCGYNRRFTRLTNAFSKKFENHAHMVALYTFGITSSAFTRRFACRPRWPPEFPRRS